MFKAILFVVILVALLETVAILRLPSGFCIAALCAAIFLVRKL